MSNKTVPLSNLNLEKEIGQILQTFANECDTAVSKASDEVTKEAVRKLKATSPVGAGTHRLGNYSKNWTSKKVEGKRVIYNRKYQLTHLLENGHNVVKNGKVVGVAPAQPHIKPVEEWVQDEFENKIKVKISEGLS